MQIMTALLEYLDLLHDAWEAKLGAKLIERSLLTYFTRLIVLCVYPEKYTPLRVQHPGYPDLRALLRAGYVTRIKLAFFSTMELKIKSSTIVINTQEPSFSG